MPNSTAHIVLPDSPRPTAKEGVQPQATRLAPNAPAEQVNAIFDGIDELLKASARGTTRERIVNLITACILNGMNTETRIVGVANRKKFKEARVRSILSELSDSLWRLEDDGTYSLID